MIPILFQDQHLVVCLKPPGLLSQDGPGDTLPETLRGQLRCGIFPVHRLDREAGGVMVYAKTKAAAGKLSRTVAQGEMIKTYLCVVRGCPQETEGVYRDLLLHDKSRNKSFVVQRMRGGVKDAKLAFRVLAARGGTALVRVRLFTGRTHQIRVQFAGRRAPLLGDRKYGGGEGNLALWSMELAFPHPISGEFLHFFAPPDGGLWEDFRDALDDLQMTDSTSG